MNAPFGLSSSNQTVGTARSRSPKLMASPGVNGASGSTCPRLGRCSTAADGKALGAAIVTLFREKEGRGDYCVVEQYRRGARGEQEYFFAYPQDHRQMAIEYDKGEMTRRPHRPAFEIIFVLDDEQRTLSIWHQGKRERIVDLQVAFAKAVLGQDILRESPRDDRVYDLDVFLDPDFIFRPRPELGIASAEVRKIGIRVLGAEQHSINISLGATTSGLVLYHRLKVATADVPKSMLRVAKIGARATFDPEAGRTRQTPRSFELASPNHCNIDNDSRGILIQRMLADHGIEPRRPPEESGDGSQGN